ncbi:hypothetical protein H8697_03375 [[Eubacterium] tenue]|nr:FxLYD domain-containing protein [[Eubacterium] tenue]MBC8630749.1 hypothetical protein [[Eubacterium] tenue]
MKRALIGITVILTLGLVGCGNASDKNLSKEDQFKNTIEESINNRWEFTDKNDESKMGTDSELDYLKDIIKQETDKLNEFKDVKFEDKKLEKLKDEYIKGLEDQENSLKYYEVDYEKSLNKWNEGANERNIAINGLYNEYKLDLDKDHIKKLQDKIDAIEETQKSKEAIENMVKNVKFTKSEEVAGWSTYIAKIKNTTNETFNQFVLDINLEDKDGNPVEKTNVLMENWKPNQEKTVQFMTDKPFDKMTYEYSIIK